MRLRKYSAVVEAVKIVEVLPLSSSALEGTWPSLVGGALLVTARGSSIPDPAPGDPNHDMPLGTALSMSIPEADYVKGKPFDTTRAEPAGIVVDAAFLAAEAPQAGGYIVRHSTGRLSFCAAPVFDVEYTEIQE